VIFKIAPDSYRYDTIRDAILACAQKLTYVRLIYRTEPKTKKRKKEEEKVKTDIGKQSEDKWSQS